MIRLWQILFLTIAVASALASSPTVLLVSIDGFRADYFEKAPVPNLRKLAKSGVSAKSLIPVFPSETFPSHYSMLTGLHPENHGIVANSIKDPVLGEFGQTKTNAAWWLGEPIWITAQKQGLLSATCFWPGTDTAIGNTRPTHWLPFDSTMSNEKRVAQIIEWLLLPQGKRPNFLTLYFGEVDVAGHQYGPNSPEVLAAISRADDAVGLLLARLEAIGRGEDINVILVSDHGMTEISLDRMVILDDYVDTSSFTALGIQTIFIRPTVGDLDSLLAKLKTVPHCVFHRREEIPERFRFRKSPRIAPIVGFADEGWTVVTRSFLPAWRRINRSGLHGYDNQLPSMRGIFAARGPAFKTNATVEPFLNVHVYELVCHILKIKPAPNDGDLNVVRPLLR